MMIVGLTGGAGSGKSTVGRYFEEIGINVIYTDKIAGEARNENIKTIVKKFGKNVIDSNGLLDRTEIRRIVFNDKDKLDWLEELLHPIIAKKVSKMMGEVITRYCLLEIPVVDKLNLFNVDRILAVLTNNKEQVKRVVTRDNVPKEMAENLIDVQTAIKVYKEKSDDVIYNNSDLKTLKNKVLRIHNKYLKLS